MTLAIDNSSIKIQNAQGVEKFNSDDNVIFLKYVQAGSVTLTYGQSFLAWTEPGDFTSSDPWAALYDEGVLGDLHTRVMLAETPGPNDFHLIQVKVEAVSNGLLTGLVGKEFAVKGALLTNTVSSVLDSSIPPISLGSSCMLFIGVRDNFLFFQAQHVINGNLQLSTPCFQEIHPTSLTLSYDIRTYSHG